MSLICPYCMVEINTAKYYDENESHEFRCPVCSKWFTFNFYYTAHYRTTKAPCWRTEKHKWKKIVHYPTDIYDNKYYCVYCKEEREIVFT